MIIGEYIREMMVETATLLGRSLDAYWPVNIGTLNDLPERNLSMHFAHAAIKRSFHIFAEINNHEKNKEERLDILCISPDNKYYLACEFKTYVYHSMEKSHHNTDSRNDILRVSKFNLNNMLPDDIFGGRFTQNIANCNKRIGIVAGVLWRNDSDSIILDSAGQRRFIDNVVKLGGVVNESPILVKRYEPVKRTTETKHWFGAYYLYYALVGDLTVKVDTSGSIISEQNKMPEKASIVPSSFNIDKILTDTEESNSESKTNVFMSPGNHLSSTGKVILRKYKDACYGEGINGTVSKCNTTAKSQVWYATYDVNDCPIWLCSRCGCQWSRKEKSNIN